MTGAVSSSAAKQKVPNENLLGTLKAADLHGLEEPSGWLNIGCMSPIYSQAFVFSNKHNTLGEERQTKARD